MSRKILFLDVDGVLNNRESSMNPMRSIFSIHPDCTRRLRDVVEDLDVKLVLSSTWRLAVGDAVDAGRIRDAMADHGWAAPPFVGCTPRAPNVDRIWARMERRGLECERWIEQNGQPGDVYVAVDDDTDFDGFRGTLVLTDFDPGLTGEKAAEIRAAFAREAA